MRPYQVHPAAPDQSPLLRPHTVSKCGPVRGRANRVPSNARLKSADTDSPCTCQVNIPCSCTRLNRALPSRLIRWGARRDSEDRNVDLRKSDLDDVQSRAAARGPVETVQSPSHDIDSDALRRAARVCLGFSAPVALVVRSGPLLATDHAAANERPSTKAKP